MTSFWNTLIARGVRAIAVIGTCEDDHESVQATSNRLVTLGDRMAIPFVVPASFDSHCLYGYASCSWAVDLLGFALSDACPNVHRHRIIGLLLGYSSSEIRNNEELSSGATWSRPPVGKTFQNPSDTEETCVRRAS